MLNLGAITSNNFSTANFVLPSGTQSSTNGITTTNGTSNGLLVTASGSLVGTVNGTDFASLSGNNIVGLATGSGKSFNTNTFTAGSNTDMNASFSPTAGFTTNSLRLNTDNQTLTLSGANTISTGAILVTSNAVPNGVTIGGTGSLTTGSSGGSLTIFNYGRLTESASAVFADNIGSGLTISGTGYTNLQGSNTYTGQTYLNGGTVVINSNANLGAPTAGGTLNLGSTLLMATGSFGLYNGTAGTNNRNVVLAGASSIDVTSGNTLAILGVISGTGSLTTVDAGTLSLSGANTYSGGTVLNAGALQLNFAGTGVPSSNILLSTGALTLAGGTLTLTPNAAASTTSSQTIGGVTLNAGASTINATTGAGAGDSTTLALGAITRNTGSALDFGTALPTSGSITTTTANALFSGGQQTILGGWATAPLSGVDAATWAVSGSGATAGAISGLPNASYYTTTTGGNTAGNYAAKDVDVTSSPTLSAGLTLNSLRFNTAAAETLALGGTTTVATGGILVTPNVGSNAQGIGSGTITSGNGQDLIVNTDSANSTLTISSSIAGAIGLTKNGPGTLYLNMSSIGNESYTGPTIVNGGTLTLYGPNQTGSGLSTTSSITVNNGGTINVAYYNVLIGPSAGSIPVTVNAGGTLNISGGYSSPLSSNDFFLVGGTLSGGTGTQWTPVLGFTAGGSPTTSVINVPALGLSALGTAFTFTVNPGATNGIDLDITSSTSLNTNATNVVKLGAGLMELTGSYQMASTEPIWDIYAGTLNVAVLANGGSNSSIGASSNAAAELVFGNARLQFTGSTAQSTDRLFTIGNSTYGDNAVLDASGTGVGTVTFSNSGAIAFGDTNPHTLTLTGSNTGNNTFAPLLGNNTGLTSLAKTGAGTWLLTNTGNTYTGTTTIDAGTLNVAKLNAGGSASSIGAATNAGGNLIFGGGSLQYTGSTAQTTDHLFTIGDANGNAATLDASGSVAAATLTFSNTGAILFGDSGVHTLTLAGSNTGNNTLSARLGDSSGGSTSLIKQGAGTWYLSAANTYSGSTTVTGGLLNVSGNSSAIGTTVNIQAGTLQVSASGQINPGSIVTLGVSPANTSGVLLLGDSVTAGDAVSQTVASLTTLGTGGSNAVIGGATTNSTLVVNNSSPDTYGGMLGGSGTYQNNLNVSKTGAGTLSLTGTTSSYTGVTTISGGTLNVASLANGLAGSSIGASSNLAGNLVFGGGTLQYTGSTAQSTDRLFTIGNSGVDSATLDASGSGSGTLSFTNTGTIGFGDTNAHTLTLTGSNTGANTLASLISNGTGGSTSLFKTGTGTWTITAANSYSGGTTVSAGTLIGTTTSLQGGILDNANLVFNQAVVTPNISNGTYAGAISGSGNVTVSSASGTVNFTGTSSSYSGVTTINTTTLNVASLANGLTNSSIGAASNMASNLVFGGGTLQFTGSTAQSTDRLFTIGNASGDSATLDASGTSSAALTFSNTGSVTFGDTNPHTLTITGSNTGANMMYATIGDGMVGRTSLVKSGTGTWYLTGTSNSYTGVTTINAGTLNVATLANGLTNSSIGASSNAASNLVFIAGSLQYTGSTAQTTDRLFTIGNGNGNGDSATLDASGSDSSTLTFNNTGAIAFGDTNAHTLNLTGSNTGNNLLVPSLGDDGLSTSLVKSGTGTWTVSGFNTYSGSTTVTGGLLNVSGNSSGIGTTVNIQAGTLQVSASGQISPASVVTLGVSPANTSGVLMLGDSVNAGDAVSQTIASLTTSGTGGSNAVVGGATTNSTLIVNNSSSDTYGGMLGGIRHVSKQSQRHQERRRHPVAHRHQQQLRRCHHDQRRHAQRRQPGQRRVEQQHRRVQQHRHEPGARWHAAVHRFGPPNHRPLVHPRHLGHDRLLGSRCCQLQQHGRHGPCNQQSHHAHAHRQQRRRQSAGRQHRRQHRRHLAGQERHRHLDDHRCQQLLRRHHGLGRHPDRHHYQPARRHPRQRQPGLQPGRGRAEHLHRHLRRHDQRQRQCHGQHRHFRRRRQFHRAGQQLCRRHDHRHRHLERQSTESRRRQQQHRRVEQPGQQPGIRQRHAAIHGQRGPSHQPIVYHRQCQRRLRHTRCLGHQLRYAHFQQHRRHRLRRHQSSHADPHRLKHRRQHAGRQPQRLQRRQLAGQERNRHVGSSQRPQRLYGRDQHQRWYAQRGQPGQRPDQQQHWCRQQSGHQPGIRWRLAAIHRLVRCIDRPLVHHRQLERQFGHAGCLG